MSLAALEYLVHLNPEDAPSDLVAMQLELPRDVSAAVQSPASLPNHWRDAEVPAPCRAIGDEWVHRVQSLTLTLPSVIIPGERNLLINPAHPDAASVRVVSAEAFVFDPRLLYDG